MYEEAHFEGEKPDYKLVLKLRNLALENISLEQFGTFYQTRDTRN